MWNSDRITLNYECQFYLKMLFHWIQLSLKASSNAKRTERQENPKKRPKFPPTETRKLLASYTRDSTCSSTLKVS